MSDNQNPNIEEVTETVVVEATPEVAPEAAVSEKPTRDARPQRGDRPRGNRRDCLLYTSRCV